MGNERRTSITNEITEIRPQQAELFFALLNGGLHIGPRLTPLSLRDQRRARKLIDEICNANVNLNRESLESMMFDETNGVPTIDGERHVVSWGILAAIRYAPKARNDWDTQLMKLVAEHYRMGRDEWNFISVGKNEFYKHHPTTFSYVEECPDAA